MSKTHKQWIRECIEECKTCGDLNTASGAEWLAAKLAEQMDCACPTPTASYQQLISGLDGNAQWSDVPYISEAITFQHPEDMTARPASGEPGSWYTGTAAADKLMNGISCLCKVSDIIPTKEELFAKTVKISVVQANGDAAGEPITYELIDNTYTFEDGSYGRWQFSLPFETNEQSEDGNWPLVWVVPEPSYVFHGDNGGAIYCSEPGVYLWLGSLGIKGGRVTVTYHRGTLLDNAVPVISSAQVGQYAVVKAVNDDGKPTKWEAKPEYDMVIKLDGEIEYTTSLSALSIESGSWEDIYEALESGRKPRVALHVDYLYGGYLWNQWYDSVAVRTFHYADSELSDIGVLFIASASTQVDYLNMDITSENKIINVSYNGGEIWKA